MEYRVETEYGEYIIVATSAQGAVLNAMATYHIAEDDIITVELIRS